MIRHYNSSARRMKRQVRNSLFVILGAALIYVSSHFMLARDRESRSSESVEAVELQKVITNPALEEEIVEYTGMTVSFNPRLHIPNWVAWELTAEEAAGEEPRSDKFMNDERVDGCPDTWDYSYSGYDRGHMAPAGDMKWGADAMKETFYLTNICPQAPELNRGAWKRLEEKCRAKAYADSAVIVICGPVLTDELTEYIGDSRVAVPRRFFKVVLSPFKENPEAIGFLMPNGYVEGGMQAAAVSVDSVEAVTGHDFFSALPDDIEKLLESKAYFNRWSHIR